LAVPVIFGGNLMVGSEEPAYGIASRYSKNAENNSVGSLSTSEEIWARVRNTCKINRLTIHFRADAVS